MIRIGAGNKRWKRRRGAVRGRRRLRPTVLTLEGRELLSTLTVSDTNDSGAGSLREAIAYANSHPRARHHHLRPGRLRQGAADHQADRRPAGPDLPGDRYDHPPGRQPADPQRRPQEPGLRHRGRVAGARGANDRRRPGRSRRRHPQRRRHAGAGPRRPPRQPRPRRLRPVQRPQRDPHAGPVAGRGAPMSSHFPGISGTEITNRITPEHETAAQIDFRPRAEHAGRG
jgi:hypothetical protein